MYPESEIYLIRVRSTGLPIYVGQHTHRKCTDSCNYWSGGKLVRLEYLKSVGESKSDYTREVIFAGRFSPDEIDELEVSSIAHYGTMFPAGRNLTQGGSSNQKAVITKTFCVPCAVITTHFGDSCASCANKAAVTWSSCESCDAITGHKENVGCLSCFRKSRYVEKWCEECSASVAHTLEELICMGCVNRARIYRKFCEICSKETAHSGGSCYGCARRSSYSEQNCEACGRITKHLLDQCVPCKRKAAYSKAYCEVCEKVTTHSGSKCFSCRVVFKKLCPECKEVTPHKKSGCLAENHPSSDRLQYETITKGGLQE